MAVSAIEKKPEHRTSRASAHICAESEMSSILRMSAGAAENDFEHETAADVGQQ